ncbi:hypothetical protein SLS57_009273 [Botryosphaeria dothidea]
MVFQEVQTLSALQTSVRFLPNAVMGIILSVGTGLILHRFSAYWIVLLASLVTAISPLLLAITNPDWSYWYTLFWAVMLSAIAADVLFVVSNLIITSIFPPSTQALAGAVFNTVSQFGTAVGLAIMGVISSNVIKRHLPTLRAFIRSNPLGILTTAIDSPAHPFLQSSHIPFLLDVLDDASETELGTLRGHMARANPQAKALMEHLKASQTQDGPQVLARDVMVLFNGPAHHYVTPRFYVETKPATGKVVPTWNYSAVQVYGRLTVYFDGKHPSTSDFLQKQVGELSQYAETQIMEYEKAWKVEDAPTAYVDALKKAIIGIEIEITDMGGKWKMSQEMGVGDRQGVVDGFDALGTEEGKKIAETVKEKGKWD